MKRLLALFLLMPFVANANPLAHTKWIKAVRSDCPDAIYFGVKRYLFINACHATAADGIVERGNYSISGDIISLSNRLPAAAQGLEGIPSAIKTLRILALSRDHLMLRVGQSVLNFRSGRLGLLHTATHTR